MELRVHRDVPGVSDGLPGESLESVTPDLACILRVFSDDADGRECM